MGSWRSTIRHQMIIDYEPISVERSDWLFACSYNRNRDSPTRRVCRLNSKIYLGRRSPRWVHRAITRPRLWSATAERIDASGDALTVEEILNRGPREWSIRESRIPRREFIPRGPAAFYGRREKNFTHRCVQVFCFRRISHLLQRYWHRYL